jgi:glycosyltransferase involved in cell wall biosynthesis
LKILLVIQKQQLRGAEVFACQLATELVGLGNEVHMACLFGTETTLKEKFPNLHFIVLEGNRGKRFLDLKTYRKINFIIRGGNYDIVQANAGDTLKYAALSKRIFGWKQPLIYRNANRMSAFLRGRFHRFLNYWLLGNCSHFISVTEDSRQDLIGLYPPARSCSVTIPIGTYSFENIKPFARAASGQGPVFTNIGSLVPEKNQTLLIDVFKKFFMQNGQGLLWIIGDGHLRPLLEKKVRDENLTGQVTFWGYRKDVIDLLKASEVLLMTSRIEGLPGVILESLACGVPVITSSAGGIAEVIKNNHNGFCLQTEDVEKYVSCMNEVVFNPEVRQRFIVNGRELIAHDFMMKEIGTRFFDFFKDITKNN